MNDFLLLELGDAPPAELALFRALSDCGPVGGRTFAWLSQPPASLQMPGPSRTAPATSLLKEAVEFDGDMAARMLRTADNQPDSEAKWTDLSPPERKRARRAAESLTSNFRGLRRPVRLMGQCGAR